MVPEPTFAFCGTFSGKDTARWIKKLEFELGPQKIDGIIPAQRLLTSVDLLLTDEAAKWAETNPDAVRILASPEPTETDVTTFKNLFQERFPAEVVETSVVSFNLELSELHQCHNETISSYYKRVCSLMLRVGARDRPSDTRNELSLLESATLDIILKAFVKGLADEDVKKDTIRGLSIGGCLLRGVCNLAEDALRSKKELKKFLDEDLRAKELQFYKSVVQKNMNSEKIEALLASYKSHLAPSQWIYEDSYLINHNGESSSTQRDNNPSRNRFQGPSPQQQTGSIQSSNEIRRLPIRSSLQPKDLPDKSFFKNPYINGCFVWGQGDGALCVKCGDIGHVAKDHSGPNKFGPILLAWE